MDVVSESEHNFSLFIFHFSFTIELYEHAVSESASDNAQDC